MNNTNPEDRKQTVEELEREIDNINAEWVKVDIELSKLQPSYSGELQPAYNELPATDWCDAVSYYFYRKKRLEYRREKLLKRWSNLKYKIN